MSRYDCSLLVRRYFYKAYYKITNNSYLIVELFIPRQARQHNSFLQTKMEPCTTCPACPCRATTTRSRRAARPSSYSTCAGALCDNWTTTAPITRPPAPPPLTKTRRLGHSQILEKSSEVRLLTTPEGLSWSTQWGRFARTRSQSTLTCRRK